jgi:hypothetical protein
MTHNNKKGLVFELYDPSKQRKSSSRTQRVITDGKKKDQDGESVIIFACKMCRLHHKRCSGERPCERCIQKGYICENLVRMSGAKKTVKDSPPTIGVDSYEQQSLFDKMYDFMRVEYDKLQGDTAVMVFDYTTSSTTSKSSIRYILN